MNIVTRKDVAESLDRVVAAALTNPDLTYPILRRLPAERIYEAAYWANPASPCHAAMIVFAIDRIHHCSVPSRPKAEGAALAVWESETAKLREVTPAGILKYLSANSAESMAAKTGADKASPDDIAAFLNVGLHSRPCAETLLEIKAHLATLKTPVSTANLGVDTERIMAAAGIVEDFAAFDLDKWRVELGECGIDDDAMPAVAQPDVIDCYAGVSMAKLAAAPSREINYLAKGVLVANQAAAMIAHEKLLKSRKVMDLMVSLSTATPFLNYFDVPTRMNVLYCSGENCEETSTDVFRDVCRSRGIDPDKVEGCNYTTWLPKFDKPDDLAELVRRIKDADAKFVAIDPAGLCLSAGAASTLCIAYDELKAVTDAVKSCGATLLLVHHATKEANVSRKGLRAAAGAGFAEWARQWLLLDRVGTFKPETGEHRIKLMAGGSRGHSGRWTVDVREGNVADPVGRVWDVKVSAVGEAKEALSDKRIAEDAAKVLDAMRRIGEAATAKAIRTKAGGMNASVFAAAVADLLDRGSVKPKTVPVRGIDRDGYELCSDAPQTEAT